MTALPTPSRWTLVGPLGPGRRAAVDRGGRVVVDPGRWALDWAVGAEDRWHHPVEEAAVRQSLVDASPVVETRLRVPGGDVVQRVYAVQGSTVGDGLPLAVVELTNRTAVPVAVALDVGPDVVTTVDPGGGADVVPQPWHRPDVRWDGTTVTVDGDVGLILPRTPGQVETGERLRLVFPLAHTATLRVLVPLAAGASAAPQVVPDGDAVARGWALQARRGATAELPDPVVTEAVDASVRSLLALVDGTDLAATAGRATPADGAAVAMALDQWGFADEAGHLAAGALAALDRLGYRNLGDLAAVMEAAAVHVALADDASFAAAAADVAVDAALVARKRGRARRTPPVERGAAARVLASCGRVLAAAGDQPAAVRALADRAAVRRRPVADEPAEPDLDAYLDTGRPTWSWSSRDEGHAAAVTARFLAAVRTTLLVDDEHDVVLLPHAPAAWDGLPVDGRDLPTRCGSLSFSVRWHGERPALLWQLDGSVPAAGLRCGLDPTWRGGDASGEALLAPPAVRRSGDLVEGESFG